MKLLRALLKSHHLKTLSLISLRFTYSEKTSNTNSINHPCGHCPFAGRSHVRFPKAVWTLFKPVLHWKNWRHFNRWCYFGLQDYHLTIGQIQKKQKNQSNHFEDQLAGRISRSKPEYLPGDPKNNSDQKGHCIHGQCGRFRRILCRCGS